MPLGARASAARARRTRARTRRRDAPGAWRQATPGHRRDLGVRVAFGWRSGVTVASDNHHRRDDTAEANVVYELEGTLLEACSCGVLCPCWIGEDPDGGACDAFNAYHFDRGTIRGIDVS